MLFWEPKHGLDFRELPESQARNFWVLRKRSFKTYGKAPSHRLTVSKRKNRVSVRIPVLALLVGSTLLGSPGTIECTVTVSSIGRTVAAIEASFPKLEQLRI